jgi:hypothetical protein
VNKYRLKYTGLNSTSFINFLVKNDIEVEDVIEDKKEMCFSINSYNYKKFKTIKNPYKVKEGSFNGYDKNNAWWSARKCFRLAELCELDFWKLVQKRAFVSHLEEMFKEVLKNIEMQ